MESNIAGLYDLDKVLGKGHYGIVRLARHVFTGLEVAVKVIDKTKLDQRETEHLLKEVQCMKLVRHPNVVRLYQVISTKNKLYLVLELGNGGDLLDYLNNMPHGIDEPRTKILFCQIIRAIAYCHHLHIVHRDLKPENIIFNEDYSVLKLTDFGFSNEFSPGQKLMTYCGSWKYSAPEILLQEEYDPPAVDVWSLGVMLFQMVAGRLPFSEVNESETLTKIMDGHYEVPDNLSPQLQDLLKKMIVVDPQHRITVDEILAHPWCAPVNVGGPINGLVHEVGITQEEHEKVTKIITDSNIASKEELDKSLAANTYDYVSATYLLLAEQLKQKRIRERVPPQPKRISDHRRGSVPEIHSELLNEIRNQKWQIRECPEHSPRTQRRKPPQGCSRSRSNTGSSCSSEEDKSPTLGGDKYLRDDDTFFKGKLKNSSPKRTMRRIKKLNIHAVGSSSEESEDDEFDYPLFEPKARTVPPQRLFRRITPPSGNLSSLAEEESPVKVELSSYRSLPRSRHTTSHKSDYADEAADIVSPLSTPITSHRKYTNSHGNHSNHSSFSSSIEYSSDDSDLDIDKKKKLTKKHSNKETLLLVKEKLAQLEVTQNTAAQLSNVSETSCSSSGLSDFVCKT